MVDVLFNCSSLSLQGFSASEAGFDLDVLRDDLEDGTVLSWSGSLQLVLVEF